MLGKSTSPSGMGVSGVASGSGSIGVSGFGLTGVKGGTYADKGIGVLGMSEVGDHGVGISGVTLGPFGIGVEGFGYYGGSFSGAIAAIFLRSSVRPHHGRKQSRPGRDSAVQ